jgi:hypothetical protein
MKVKSLLLVALPPLFSAAIVGIVRPQEAAKLLWPDSRQLLATKEQKAFQERNSAPKPLGTPPIVPFYEVAPTWTGEASPESDGRRPIVYHYGQLPEELPTWFSEVDRDHDGQLSLFEWNEAHLPLALFEQLDLNDDGFVTPEEILRHLAHVGSADLQVQPSFDPYPVSYLGFLEDDSTLDDENFESGPP